MTPDPNDAERNRWGERPAAEESGARPWSPFAWERLMMARHAAMREALDELDRLEASLGRNVLATSDDARALARAIRALARCLG